MKSFLVAVLSLSAVTIAAPALEKRLAPSVQLDSGNVVGTSLLGVDSFRGIPFAKPPVGPLRLKPPQPITTNLGTINAVGIPRACPQFLLTGPDLSALPEAVADTLSSIPLLLTSGVQGEDCLTVNVQRPSTATASSKLPVIFWIYGGGFAFGSTSTYDGSEFVLTSVAQKKSVIYVAVNYRVGGFGFLAGSEILKDGSANLGLLDQRLALQWVADNIAKFGGDPDKVTIWGESAGSISVFDQMALYDGDNTYKGKPLFRAGIMDSGTIVPSDPVDCPKGQNVYNNVVKAAGCSGAPDTLACLRSVDYPTFYKATTSVPGIFGYQSVALAYLPRPDGTALTASPDVLAQSGKYASVPFIVGDQEDEGTLFSLSQSNITTTAQLETYLGAFLFNDATPAQIHQLVSLYPDDPSAGSPFNTGPFNNIYPQYKRIAALLGDLTFTLSRRIFLDLANTAKPTVPNWSYLSSYFYGTPILGTFHASDILPAFGILPGIPSASIQRYYINFINDLDPNSSLGLLRSWPKWKVARNLLHFNALSNGILKDDFRSNVYDFIRGAASSFHI